MLAQRVITALVLLALLLPTVFWADAWAWQWLTLLFLVVAMLEWGALLPRPGHRFVAAAGLAVTGSALILYGVPVVLQGPAATVLFALATGWWITGGALRLRRHDARAGGHGVALLLLFVCWLSLLDLRERGTVCLLSSMAIVWVADIAAYFCGKAFGRRKLAPAISPGKSVEGALGGLLFVAAIGLACILAPLSALGTSLPVALAETLGAPATLMLLGGLAALSIVGDLHESLLKRQAGVKDSGWILPGHGGVLDRIDALIPAMPAAALLLRVFA